MATKDEKKLAPICKECGGRMSHYVTLPKTGDRPRVTIYRCDHCGETVITPKSNGVAHAMSRDTLYFRISLVWIATLISGLGFMMMR
jgi:DNA-directed RNA polymerase subunit RPC12/RpoP